MADETKNPKVPSLDKVMALPKIVRVTAITLLAYGVAMFSLGVYLPIRAYKDARGYDFSYLTAPFFILIGLIIILISFSLFKGGYEMLHRRAYGAGVGIGATMLSFFPAAYFIFVIVPVSNEWARGDEKKKFLAVLFLLLNLIFLYALSRADKILRSKS